MLSVVMLSVFMLSVYLFMIIKNAIILGVIMLNVIMLIVVAQYLQVKSRAHLRVEGRKVLLSGRLWPYSQTLYWAGKVFSSLLQKFCKLRFYNIGPSSQDTPISVQ
jgi:hypothetical protein